MVTAICNIYINSEEKLALLKETFPLVYEVSDNWLVYIRGKFRNEAVDFVKNIDLDEKNCIIFENLHDNDWAKSTRKMLEQSKYDYVYTYLEDHFLMKSMNHFEDVIRDMIENKIDYFSYSFFNVGLGVQGAEALYPEYSKYFYSFLLKQEKIEFLKKNNNHFYPYSLASSCSKRYFSNLLKIENKVLVKIPVIIQALMENIFFFYPRNRNFWFNINKFVSNFGIRFIIYPRATPFDLEKSLFDCDEELLPIKIGGLKDELFANWDDDNKLSNSSLVKRGLYPKNFKINKDIKSDLSDSKEYLLGKGQSESHQYCPDIARIINIPTKYIYIKKGELKISSKLEAFVLSKDQSVWIAANIPHTFFACEDCEFLVYLDSGL